MPVVPPGPPSLCLLQLCEKEEEELTERSEQDSGINEEPLLTAEQVPLVLIATMSPVRQALAPQHGLGPPQPCGHVLEAQKEARSRDLGIQGAESRYTMQIQVEMQVWGASCCGVWECKVQREGVGCRCCRYRVEGARCRWKMTGSVEDGSCTCIWMEDEGEDGR